jgi:hypothetical protein
VVVGDLGLNLFGMGDEVWSRVAAAVKLTMMAALMESRLAHESQSCELAPSDRLANSR